jgi:hypothetical protein
MNIKSEVLDELQRLREENAQLKGELPIMPHPKIHRFGLGLDAFTCEEAMLVKPDGKYVLYTDYLWMANYADRLVEFCNLPCLPADLENLRASNLLLATENLALSESLRSMKTDEK